MSNGEAYLHSRCHPASPTWCVIVPNGGLRVECAQCGQVVVQRDGPNGATAERDRLRARVNVLESDCRNYLAQLEGRTV